MRAEALKRNLKKRKEDKIIECNNKTVLLHWISIIIWSNLDVKSWDNIVTELP